MGKLTERNDRRRTKIITEPRGLYRFLATPGLEETNLAFASDEVVLVCWKLSAEEYVHNPPHTNEVIGAYVIAGARIHMYNFLDRLQENAIYCDKIRLYLFSRGAIRGRSQQGTSWEHEI